MRLRFMPDVVDGALVVPRPAMGDVLPFTDEAWRSYLTMGGDTSGAAGYAFPDSIYRTADAPGVDPLATVRARLERTGTGAALLDTRVAGSISAVANADLAAALASAANDWLAAEWLERDKRLSGAIVVGPRDPSLAAAEINRLADDDRFVAVVLAYPPALLGDRSMHPIFAAACDVGRPVILSTGGAYAGVNKGLTGAGAPVTPLEFECGGIYAAQPHLLNVLFTGLFDRFSDLRILFSGYGSAWLPSLLWRADREVRHGRLERTGALTRLPSEYVADHIRLTTAPLELPEDPAKLLALLELIDGERLLLFASGAGGDAPTDLPGDSERWRSRVLSENAAALFSIKVPA
jgi:uncharacterized protein